MLGVGRLWRQMGSSWVPCEIQVGWGSHYSLGVTHKCSSPLPPPHLEGLSLNYLAKHTPARDTAWVSENETPQFHVPAPRNMELLGFVGTPC